MEVLLVKILTTPLALSQVTITPDTAKTDLGSRKCTRAGR